MALLEVKDLRVSFVTRNGTTQAVDGIDFSVDRGRITAIIGESGSGKSVACYSLLGLIPQPPGRIDGGTALFEGRDLLSLSERELRKVRGRDIAMVFQDPMTCLNPFLRIGEQLIEPLVYHQRVSKAQARERALALLEEVGIRDPASTIDNYPHQFSGGMRQRVMIAMALINEPKLLIADEPTTALDVTIQAQILQLLAELQQRRDIGVIFISHDLAVVADIADEIVVMQRGKIVERGDSRAIFHNAQHTYTQALLAAIPRGTKTRASNAVQQEAIAAPGGSTAEPGAGTAEPGDSTAEHQSSTHRRGDSDIKANHASASALGSDEVLIEVKQLRTWFHSDAELVKAVDDVSFDIRRGEVLGLVGESGSGKSTLGRSLLRLVPVSGGRVLFDGTDVTALEGRALKRMRRCMQMIFQDPFASLNPRMTVYDTLAEPLLLHGIESRRTVEQAVLKLMDDVGLARAFVRKYPHEFSGGQRQRIAIGRALATRPEFVVADEPVSALDVTIQAQILELMQLLGEEYGLTMLFVSHDLAVVRQIADRIMVLHHGQIVETADATTLFNAPQQDYTRELLASIPGQALLA